MRRRSKTEPGARALNETLKLHGSCMCVARRRRAVTFIELMIVLAIMGVMLSITLFSVKGSMGRNRLSAAARDLVSVARYARQKAVMRGEGTEIRLDMEKGRFQFRLSPVRRKGRSRNSGSGKRTRMERVRYLSERQGDVYFKRIMLEGIEQDKGGIIKVRFNKNGSAMPTVIVLSGTKGGTLQIEIAGSTGAVRVTEIENSGKDEDR